MFSYTTHGWQVNLNLAHLGFLLWPVTWLCARTNCSTVLVCMTAAFGMDKHTSHSLLHFWVIFSAPLSVLYCRETLRSCSGEAFSSQQIWGMSLYVLNWCFVCKWSWGLSLLCDLPVLTHQLRLFHHQTKDHVYWTLASLVRSVSGRKYSLIVNCKMVWQNATVNNFSRQLLMAWCLPVGTQQADGQLSVRLWALPDLVFLHSVFCTVGQSPCCFLVGRFSMLNLSLLYMAKL